MATILRYVNEPFVFDPEATHAMSVAFDDVCRTLNVPHTAYDTRQVIATTIIALARCGERDPDRLRDGVITEARAANGSGSGT